MPAISGTVWCLTVAIILCGFLVQVEPRDVSWPQRRTSMYEDETEVIEKEPSVEELFERYLVDLEQFKLRSETNYNASAITISIVAPTGKVEVRERNDRETLVAYVSLYDANSGDNGGVECELDDNYFKLVTLYDTEYKIVTTQVLDREKQAVHKLIINCHTQGEEPQISTKEFMVNILDINDNRPVITIPTLPKNLGNRVTVRENAPPGAFVTYISVSDADSGDNGKVSSCELEEDHKFRLVKLDETEYKVITIEVFDRESSSWHNLRIRCQDSGSPRKTATKSLSVYIEDVNDNAPVFREALYTTSMRENNTVGKVIMRLYANDADIGYNADLDYTLDQAADGYFTADGGQIVTAAVLKHNETPEVTFYYTASDRGSPSMSGRTQVKIVIIENNNNDDNNNDDNGRSDDRPELEEFTFTEHSYHFDILENVTVGTTIGRVQTTNPRPRDTYYHLSYRWHTREQGGEVFEIDSDTGDIVLKTPLDFELASEFVMSAGATRLSYWQKAQADVKVVVVDINDNAPYIKITTIAPSSEAEVGQHAEPGTLVAYVSVYDADSGDNGQFSCELDDDHFRLVVLYRTEFKIVTTAEIEHNYMLTIKCEDKGEIPLTTAEQLAVNVIAI